MKKLFIAAFSIICSTQQTHSMEKEEQQITTTMKDEYCEILRKAGKYTVERYSENSIYVAYSSGHGFGGSIPQTMDLLSLKLYNKNLNESEIENLVNQGADVNHKDRVFRECYDSIGMYHAYNDTEQGVKNMAQLIKHGVKLHNNHYYLMRHNPSRKTPLTIAAERNNTGMVKLLLRPTLLADENPEVITDKKEQFQTVIDYVFKHQNVEVITSLLDLNLMTPDEGLENFANYRMPNKEILNLLHERQATCNDMTFTIIRTNAFPCISSIQLFEQIVTLDNRCTPEVLEWLLERLHIIQTMVTASINSLENNKANQEK